MQSQEETPRGMDGNATALMEFWHSVNNSPLLPSHMTMFERGEERKRSMSEVRLVSSSATLLEEPLRKHAATQEDGDSWLSLLVEDFVEDVPVKRSEQCEFLQSTSTLFCVEQPSFFGSERQQDKFSQTETFLVDFESIFPAKAASPVNTFLDEMEVNSSQSQVASSASTARTSRSNSSNESSNNSCNSETACERIRFLSSRDLSSDSLAPLERFQRAVDVVQTNGALRRQRSNFPFLLAALTLSPTHSNSSLHKQSVGKMMKKKTNSAVGDMNTSNRSKGNNYKQPLAAHRNHPSLSLKPSPQSQLSALNLSLPAASPFALPPPPPFQPFPWLNLMTPMVPPPPPPINRFALKNSPPNRRRSYTAFEPRYLPIPPLKRRDQK